LEAASYPLQGIEVIDRENDGVELVATLLGTAANPRELDEIVSHLDRNPHVESASWSLRTTE
jgi:putative Mg2+ transporter-C (MgtC) family protein